MSRPAPTLPAFTLPAVTLAGACRAVAATAIAGALAWGIAAPAQAAECEDVRLMYSRWVPPTHQSVPYLEDWFKQVSDATEGRVTIGTLPKPLGKPQAHFDLVKAGTVDFTVINNSYTPGRFVAEAGAELPFTGNLAGPTSIAFWRTYEKFLKPAGDFEGVKLLALSAQTGGDLWLKNKSFSGIDDLNGLKVRVAGAVTPKVADALGMVGVLKPITEVYEMLSAGIIDGIFTIPEGIMSFKLEGQVDNVVKVPGGFYRLTSAIIMSERKWNEICAKDQAAIDAIAGEELSWLYAHKTYDLGNEKAVGVLDKAGVKVIEADAATVEAMRQRLAGIEQEWIAELKAERGMDNGAEILDYLRQEADKVAAERAKAGG